MLALVIGIRTLLFACSPVECQLPDTVDTGCVIGSCRIGLAVETFCGINAVVVMPAFAAAVRLFTTGRLEVMFCAKFTLKVVAVSVLGFELVARRVRG